MPRHVLINEAVDPATATPYSDEQAAFAAWKALWLAHVAPMYEYEPGEEEYDQIANAKSIDDVGACADSDPVFLVDEGEAGVWTGFSSADRCVIAGPYPNEPGEFMGNGDPVLYRTAGIPDGVTISTTEPIPYEDHDEEEDVD